MYQTETLLRRTLRVHYPEGKGRMVLRSELDWDHDLAAEAVSGDGHTSTFTLEAKKPFLHFKPVLKTTVLRERWAVGANMLLSLTSDEVADVYPHFESSE